jgi:hypothetical protein
MKKTLLSLSLITFTLVGKAQDCTELYISEYVEGSGNSKAMEFFNPTNATISMSNYRLVRYSNGSATGSDSTNLTGSVASFSTFVIANGVGVTSSATGTSPACDPALQALAQQIDGAYPAPTFMNGDDALALVRISPYKIIDIFGKIGEQPATAWSDVAPYDGTIGKWWTKDHSLQRKSTVKQGVTTSPTLFNVKLEWDSLPKDNWTNVGIHSCDCIAAGVKENNKSIYLKVFPNPANGSQIAFVSDNLIVDIKLINAIGQTVYVSQANDKTVIVKDLDLPSGIYYAIVKNSIGTKTQKIIIQ